VPEESLTALRSAVSHRLDIQLRAYREKFSAVGHEVADLFDVATPLLQRGKRLRASFLAAGWRCFGGRALAGAETAAGAGLELFQLAALVHDDLMDASLSRRGLPAAHLQFRALHEERTMISNPDSFGAAGALLLGDLLLVAAESELQAALIDHPDTAPAARAVFEEMMAEVTVGQYLDIYAQSAPWAEDPEVDLDRARRVIKAKSARYSVEHPLALGAAMAGADRAGCEAIRAVGLPVGEAFQMRDDVLSVFGDPAVTGKPAGDDLREGKRTVLVTSAMTLASPPEVEILRSRIGDPGLTEDQVVEVREILTSCGALAEVEELISQRAATAQAAIDALDLPAEQDQLLRELATAAITRNQ